MFITRADRDVANEDPRITICKFCGARSPNHDKHCEWARARQRLGFRTRYEESPR